MPSGSAGGVELVEKAARFDFSRNSKSECYSEEAGARVSWYLKLSYGGGEEVGGGKVLGTVENISTLVFVFAEVKMIDYESFWRDY